MPTRRYNSYVLAVVFICHISYFYTTDGCPEAYSVFRKGNDRKPLTVRIKA